MKSVNQIRLIALMAAAATLFGGCEKESDNAVDNAPVAAHITSAIDGMTTRAAGTAWVAGDAIGISGTSGPVEYKNIKYVALDGNGVFTPDDGASNNIYFQNKNEVTFTAYYPHNGTSGTVPGTNGVLTKTITAADQTADGQTKIDYLFATATGSSTNPNVQFLFKHRMSRLILNFKPGDGIASLSDITYTLSGLVLEGTFNTTTGEAQANVSTSAADLTLTVPSSTPGMSSSLIVFPQAKDQVTITITMGGVNYTGTIDFPTGTDTITKGIEAGKYYTYNIKVNNTGLTISPATVDAWEKGEEDQNIDTTN